MSAIDHLPERLARPVADPKAYAEMDSLHEVFAEIRRDHPFARGELHGGVAIGCSAHELAECHAGDVRAKERFARVDGLDGLDKLFGRGVFQNVTARTRLQDAHYEIGLVVH
jgi:hypothetical protein